MRLAPLGCMLAVNPALWQQSMLWVQSRAQRCLAMSQLFSSEAAESQDVGCVLGPCSSTAAAIIKIHLHS